MEKPNDHHILFSRPSWTSNRDAAFLREESGLIARMDYDTHKELHRAVPFVPLPSHYDLQRIRSGMRRSRANKPLDVMDDFMRNIQEVGLIPKTTALERELGALTIVACEMQREFIEDGQVKAKIFDMGGRKDAA